ncbi:protein CREG2 isoform X1 [Nannospalax galili]|uniref:protein CREG2 isoform X1 n=1 Tax=Nannospalax galili TaxID=1026970 RepID=UPI0004ED1C4D|nr:protein CREG2 isoform X1 [Nannospalax galili]
MSVSGGERPARPGTRLSWLLCCSALLSPAASYVIVSSVSWAVTNEVDEELDSASTEEALPALLEDSGSIWQQSFPASAHKEDAHLRPRGSARARPGPAPRGMFSYRRESDPAGASSSRRLHAGTARSLVHASAWGCLATASSHDQIQGLPFGSCMAISDGPFHNSTGVPFFYVTTKDPVVVDLVKNPMASLMLPESEGDFCRKNIVDPEDPRCARLTLTGRMIVVPPEEGEFAKQAMFSRHPGMRKWPRQYEWFFMKMSIEHIWLLKCCHLDTPGNKESQLRNFLHQTDLWLSMKLSLSRWVWSI